MSSQVSEEVQLRKRFQRTRCQRCEGNTITVLDHVAFLSIIALLVLVDTIMFFVSLTENFNDPDDIVSTVSLVISCLFLVEVVVRFAVLRMKMCDWWQPLDALVVVLALVLEVLNQSSVIIFLRVVRVLRIALLAKRHGGRLRQQALYGALSPLELCIQSLSKLRDGDLVKQQAKDEIDVVIKILKSGNLHARETLLSEEDAEDDDLRKYVLAKHLKKIRIKTPKKSTATVELQQKGFAMFDNTETQKALDQMLDDWDFDVFKLEELTQGNAMLAVGMRLFEKSRSAEQLDVDASKFKNFFWCAQRSHFRNAAYHNATKAADSLQALYWMLYGPGQIAEMFNPTPEEVLALIIAAAIKDVDHPGVTNSFLEQARLPVSLVHNGSAVLERHHLSTAFHIMLEPAYAILEDLAEEEYHLMRSMVIELVLATNTKLPLTHVGQAQTKISINSDHRFAISEDDEAGAEAERLLLFKILLQYCDFAPNLRPKDLSVQWAALETEEHFRQGDLERALDLEVSSFFDRKKPMIGKERNAFLRFWVKQVHDVLCAALPKEVALTLSGHLQDNVDYWHGHMSQQRLEGEKYEYKVPALGENRGKVLTVSKTSNDKYLRYLRSIGARKAFGGQGEWCCLHIRMVEGRHISGVSTKGVAIPPDSYVKISLRIPTSSGGATSAAQQVRKSNPVAKSMFPVWAYDCTILVPLDHLDQATVVVQVYNVNRLIGQHTCPLVGFKDHLTHPDCKTLRKWRSLEDIRGATNYSGQVLSTFVLDTEMDVTDSVNVLLNPAVRVKVVAMTEDDISTRTRLLDSATIPTEDVSALSIPALDELLVCVGTWNMGEAPPPDGEELEKWLKPGYHLYAVGTQECTYSKWTVSLQEHFNRPAYKAAMEGGYVKVDSVTLLYVKGKTKIETKLSIYAAQSVAGYISEVRQLTKSTGAVGGVIGNKGACSISFNIYDSRICFVNSHLAAHQNKQQARNQNARDITGGLKAQVVDKQHMVDLDVGYDHVFWCGDLNYRLDLNDERVEKTPTEEQFNQVVNASKEKDYYSLIKFDQLKKEMAAGKVFTGFKEHDMDFGPTFKVLVGESGCTYDPERLPAYCDRILVNTRQGAYGGEPSCTFYTSAPNVSTSDHKPVSAAFVVTPFVRQPTPRGVPAEEQCVTLSYLSLAGAGMISVPDDKSATASASVPVFACQFASHLLCAMAKTPLKSGPCPVSWEDAELPALRLGRLHASALTLSTLFFSVWDGKNRVGDAAITLDEGDSKNMCDGGEFKFGCLLSNCGTPTGAVLSGCVVLRSVKSLKHARPGIHRAHEERLSEFNSPLLRRIASEAQPILDDEDD